MINQKVQRSVKLVSSFMFCSGSILKGKGNEVDVATTQKMSFCNRSIQNASFFLLQCYDKQGPVTVLTYNVHNICSL